MDLIKCDKSGKWYIEEEGRFMQTGKESEKRTVKHVLKEGSRFHVLSYDSNGTHCNVTNCEINQQRED